MEENEEFEFGPIQKEWLKSLKENPERQMRGNLGYCIKDGVYNACCLGEGGLIAGVCEWNEGGVLVVKNSTNKFNYTILIDSSYKALGLYDERGSTHNNSTLSLSELNDNNYSWPMIANIIERNPSLYLKESK